MMNDSTQHNALPRQKKTKSIVTIFLFFELYTHTRIHTWFAQIPHGLLYYCLFVYLISSLLFSPLVAAYAWNTSRQLSTLFNFLHQLIRSFIRSQNNQQLFFSSFVLFYSSLILSFAFVVVSGFVVIFLFSFCYSSF